MKDGQLELKDLTAASLDKLLGGHEALRAQQGKLYQGQEQMESSLKDNLVRLSQEKALIASGQELVAQLIQGITQKIGEVLHSPKGCAIAKAIDGSADLRIKSGLNQRGTLQVSSLTVLRVLWQRM